MTEEFLCTVGSLRAAVVQHGDRAAHAVDFLPVVSHQHHGAGKVFQRLHQFQFRLPPQIAVQCRQRFVQQKDPGIREQDPGQSGTLLFSAGQLPGKVAAPVLQMEPMQYAVDPAVRFPALHAPCHRAQVLLHRHVGKQGVVLKQQSHIPLLRRQVDSVFAVEQGHAVDFDVSPVRSRHSGDASQGHGLAAAGRPQQTVETVPGVKGDIQMEIPHLFLDIHKQAHFRTSLLSRRSSRFTAMSTTKEMAMLIITHRKARASLLVRHS